MSTKNRRSIATIDSPEFINIEGMNNPLISKCEIKVLYVGENRNRSVISKEVATEMAQTLPGCPIVGWFVENKEDFGDHGHQMIIDGEGVKFNTMTKPYGFVAPDSKVWFQKFDDTDEFGNTVTREYLMTEGYLWTGQFEEAKRVITQGNPQSMELDEDTLKGYWAEDYNRGIDFFIINDAVFSKLCILGDDVEPCFEGASVTAPQVSTAFSKDESFTKSLSTMMAELKFALQQEGGLSMENQETPVVEPVVENPAPAAGPTENFSNNEGNSVIEPSSNVENNTEEFAKKEPEENKDDNSNEEPKEKSEEPEDKDGKEPEKDKDEEEDDKDKKPETKHSLHSDEEFDALQAELSELKINFASLEEENKKLIAFKQEVEDKQKDEMIASFYMLSDEDKKDVIANKANYSLDDIKAKLSIICVDKRVDFSLGETDKNTHVEEPVVTFNLDSHEVDTLPAWLKAVKAVQDNQ